MIGVATQAEANKNEDGELAHCGVKISIIFEFLSTYWNVFLT